MGDLKSSRVNRVPLLPAQHIAGSRLNLLGVAIIAAKLADDVPLFGFGVLHVFALDLDETLAGAK